MEFLLASPADIQGVLSLHATYHIETISDEDRVDGFVTTPFTPALLLELIQQEKGLFIAKQEGIVVAYIMFASWHYWSKWPIFQHMISLLPTLTYGGNALNTDNSFQYGPVCVHKAFRGQGVLEALFAVAKQEMALRYKVLLTFINKKNPRSFAFHTRKIGLEVIHEFDFNNNNFYELAYLVTKD